ncbi:thioredoxin domain-containing protein [Trueperella bernardiae]|uniref:Thioredoxin domain-containing protein n=1 Tax=Trueperella bernardiae TaxID=59561 RepID=A0AAW6ZKD9_9ACTO|nr:thioredoxin domain-containing protein [Trueperella bernardiae]MDK8601821.1 thioredoxin domain-containing protein [Trueperella bernardiae]
MNKTVRNLIMTVVLLATVVVALVVMLVLNRSSEAEPEPTTPSASATSEATTPDGASPSAEATEPAAPSAELKELVEGLWRLDPDDPMAVGDLDADIVMQVYFDFRCGYCAKAATETEPKMQHYIDDGTVRVEYHNLAILGDESTLLAQGAVAAANQGKFLEYHSYVYDHHVAGDAVEASEDGIAAVAKAIGVADLEKFRADMTAPETVAAIEDVRTTATSLGISGTPAFIVGYSYVPGFIPIETMDQVIATELARPKD